MDDRMRILEKIEAGELDVEEGARRLEALIEASEAIGPSEPPDASASPIPRPTLVRWLWQIVFWTGVGLMAAGGLLLAPAYAGAGARRALVWGWVLFALGMLGLALGWWLQRARWLFLRVRQSDGPNISFALPLPLGPIAWVLRIARPFVPQLRETGVDELLLALQEEVLSGRILAVEVNEGEGREQVQVYFG